MKQLLPSFRVLFAYIYIKLFINFFLHENAVVVYEFVDIYFFFRRLFEEHPDIQEKFYFAADKNQNIDAIMADTKLASHAKGVIDTISFAVSCLHDLSGLVPILKQLGAAHAKFQLEDKHFQVISLICLILLPCIYTHGDGNIFELHSTLYFRMRLISYITSTKISKSIG